MLNKLPAISDKTQLKALAAMIISTAIWGVAPPVIKYTLDLIPVYTFLFYRFLIVCILIFPYLYLEVRRVSVSLRDFPALVFTGLLGQTSIILVFISLKYTSSVEVAVMGIIAPLLLVAAGHYFFNEKVDKHIEAGLIITSLGTLFLALGPILSPVTTGVSKWEQIYGNLVIMLYNIVWTAHILWSKRIRGENSPKVNKLARWIRVPVPRKQYSSGLITGVSFYVGLATLAPFYVLEAIGVFGPSTFTLSSLNVSGWAGLLFLAVFSSVVAYGLFEWSLKYLKVTDTVIFSYIAPIFTFPAAFFILGELPTKELILGTAIVAVGIWVAERKRG